VMAPTSMARTSDPRRPRQGHPARGRIDEMVFGIAVDVEGASSTDAEGPGQRREGRIFRRTGDSARPDSSQPPGVELVYDRLPEPIDLEIDPATRTLYWTDRETRARNTAEPAAARSPSGKREAPESSSPPDGRNRPRPGSLRRRMFVTDLGGSLYSLNVDGSKAEVLLSPGNLTGIAYAAKEK